MIIGIEGSFRIDFGYIARPTHKDFKLVSFDETKKLNMNNVDPLFKQMF